MNKLVFFDVDGTLVTYKNELLDSTKQAIQDLKAKGHMPIISTGRPPKMLEPIAEELAIDNYISLNGQHIVIEGETIYSNPIPTAALDDLIQASYDFGDRTFVLTEDKVIGNSFMSDMLEDSEFLTEVYTHMMDMPIDLTNRVFKHMTDKPLTQEKYADENILTAFINTEEANDDLYRGHFPDLHFTRATPMLSEVIMKGIHKATGISKIIEYLGKTIQDTIAFGDGLNDIEMIEIANTGVAMGNGREELKAVADYVTTDVDEDGIYNGLNHLELI